MNFQLFLISIFLNLLKADLSNLEYREIEKLSELSYYNGEDFIIPKECSDILNSFAQYASTLTMCSIQYARPIRICEKCYDHYTKFRDEYQDLLSKVVNGTSCSSIFISHDRLNAVYEYHNSILNIWNKGHCDSCYDLTGETAELSNKTKIFNRMLNETMDCINNKDNNSDVCEKCKQPYIQLDEYYKTLSTDAVGVDQICMDTVDSMNATRSIWSKQLNCCKLRKTPEIMFLCCTAIVAILPFLYYFSLRYCGPIRDLPHILGQSRFRQIILRSANRGVD